jgi:hypothetical protein
MVIVRNPVHSSKRQSRPHHGNRTRRAARIAKRIRAASAKRMPAKLIGGRSRRPTLIVSQVDPQMAHSPANAAMALTGVPAGGNGGRETRRCGRPGEVEAVSGISSRGHSALHVQSIDCAILLLTCMMSNAILSL